MRKISIIGVGRVGGALAIALSRKGYQIENLIVRNDQTAKKVSEIIEPKPQILSSENLPDISSEIVFIAAQDSEIENAAQMLAGKLKKSKPFVFHTSGSLSSEILKPLQKIGCPTGSIHPLVSVSDAVLGATRFADAYFCLEGDAAAVETARLLVADLGGKAFSIETKYKTLYHASAVTACGHLVALVDVAIEMLEKCGLDRNQARETLLPLIKSTVENLEVQTTAEALTGTFARGDAQTFEKHLAALDKNISGEAREIYLQLGARSAHLAKGQGAKAENLKEILDKISLAKKNFRC
jgi:predicted short-subunit dehydrogenase-like oxidoreductase (DUF2520 family)